MQLRTNQLKLQLQSFAITSLYFSEALKRFFTIKVVNLKVSCFTTLMKPLEYLNCVLPDITQGPVD